MKDKKEYKKSHLKGTITVAERLGIELVNVEN